MLAGRPRCGPKARISPSRREPPTSPVGAPSPCRKRDRSKAGSRLLGSLMKGCRSASRNATSRSLRDTEQRTQQSAVGELADRRHPGKPVRRRCGLGGGSDGSRSDHPDGDRSASADRRDRGTSRQAGDSARSAPPLGSRFAAFLPSRPVLRGGWLSPTARLRAAGFRRRFPAAAGDPRSARRSRPPLSRAQRSARMASAKLSGPPETATARNGELSKRAIEASEAANSPRVRGLGWRSACQQPSRFFSATACSLIALPGLREVVIELGERDAGVLLLVGAGERHAEFQQIVGRLRPLWIVLVALGEGAGRLRVPAARVIGLAQPVLCAAGQRVVRDVARRTSSRPLRQQDSLPASSSPNAALYCSEAEPAGNSPADGGRRFPAVATFRGVRSRLRRARGSPGGVRVPAPLGRSGGGGTKVPGGIGSPAGLDRAELAAGEGPRIANCPAGTGIGYSGGGMRARRRVPGRPLTLPWTLAESQVDVAVDLLETAPQLLDPVHRVLDASGQFAHLGFQSVHAQLGIDRPCRPSADHRGRAAAVDLPLQHAEIPLQAIQAVLHRPILRACRRGRQGHDDERQEQRLSGEGAGSNAVSSEASRDRA